MNNNIISDSIFKRRIKKFKSMKRAYYSFIILLVSYIFSLFASFFVNSSALLVKYANKKYDLGEEFIDLNQNNVRDDGENFTDAINKVPIDLCCF